MKRWHLQYIREDGRWVVMMEWRLARNLFKRKTTRWVIGNDAGDSYPMVRASPAPILERDTNTIRAMLYEARHQRSCDEAQANNRH